MKKISLIVLCFVSLIFVSSSRAQPTLSQPANDASGFSCEGSLAWGHSTGTPSTWILEISTVSPFSASITRSGGYSGSTGMYTMKYNELLGSNKYYWRVKTTFSNGNQSGYSSVRNFTTAPRPSTSIVHPSNDATNVEVPVVFSWMHSDNVTYHFWLWDESEKYYFADTTLTTSGFTWNGASPNTKYYWKLRPDAISMGLTTSNFNFTTKSATGIQSVSSEAPREFQLFEYRSDPINQSTKIKFRNPQSSDITIKIVNVSGKEVAMLVHDHLGRGEFDFSWNSKGMSSGLYVCCITSTPLNGQIKRTESRTKKILLK